MSLLRLTKNFSYVFSARIITTVLATGSMIFLIRYLGPKEFGIYSYVVTIMGLLGIFADCGIGLYLVGRISSDKKTVNKFFSAHIVLQIIISIVFIGGLLIFAILQKQLMVRNLIFIGSVGLFFSNFHIPFATVLKGMEDMKYFVYLSILSGLVTILIIFLGIYFQCNLVYFGLLALMPGVFSFIISLIFARKYITFEKVEFKQIKNIFITGLPYGFLVATGFLYSRIDILMLKRFASDTDVGLYSAAYKLIFFLNIIPTALNAALYPMLSNYCKNANHKIEYILIKLSKFLIIITLLISFYIYNYAFDIIHILFGNSFIYSGLALQLLIISFIPNCVRVPISNYLLAEGHIKKLSSIIFLVFILNVVLNYFLIPAYSLYGAAIATVFCEYLILAIYYLMIIRKYPNFLRNISFIPISFLVFLSIMMILYVDNTFLIFNYWIIYLFILFLIKIINKNEISIIYDNIKYYMKKLR